MTKPAKLKAEILSEGIDFDLDFFSNLDYDFYDNQYVYGRTSKNVLPKHRLPQALNLGNGVIASTLRRNNSSFKLQNVDQEIRLLKDDNLVSAISLPERPAYFGKKLSDGTSVESFVAVAGESTPGFFLYPECFYFPMGKPCKFCSLKHTRKTAGKEMEETFQLENVIEATKIFQKTPWKEIPIISITTGTFPDYDEGTIYTANIVSKIYGSLNPKIPIHLLTMPPKDLSLLEQYKESGVTSIAFNIEIWDHETFKQICPAKESTYGYKRMLEALLSAVKVFGEYNVFCGFVWGLESFNSLMEGYMWCLNNGISVSSNVFHADQGSVFSTRKHPSSSHILDLCEMQTKMHDQFPGYRSIFPMSMRSTLDWEVYRGDFQ